MSLGQSFAAISQPILPCKPHLGSASALLIALGSRLSVALTARTQDLDTQSVRVQMIIMGFERLDHLH